MKSMKPATPMPAAPSLRTRLSTLSRDKADTVLLLASALLVLAPHALHLPLWVSLLCGLMLFWRATITLSGQRMPRPLLLLPLALAAMAGVQFSYDTILGKDAGVAMLVLLVTFKMLEMHARRDLFVVVFLCFFLALTNFFYAQGIGTALMMLVSVWMLVATQLTFQFTGSVPPLRKRLGMAARTLAFAAPVAVLLFVVFPRIQGPLWSMPGGPGAGMTGLSEDMAPGRMSSLALSEEPAFRVRFDGAAPDRAGLYWRGPVLDVFDGLTWTRNPERSAWRESQLALAGPELGYEVTMEPSESRWIFMLEMPGEIPDVPGYRVRLSERMELTTSKPISSRVRYRAVSHTDYRLHGGPQLPDPERWLALPLGFNPRALAEGRALRGFSQPERRVQEVLAKFGREPFSYTLEPPLLGRETVDEFLYGTRAGFCEHYSSAFVFLMRAAGVPARVVTGYQGGETNPLDGFMTVRQSDAHAWAEVWLPNRGWMRVDPTAAVAPERVRRGLAASVSRPAPFGIDALRGVNPFNVADNPWLAQLRHGVNAINNGWNQWVLNYTPDRQRNVVQSLQQMLFGWQLAVLAIACAGGWLLAKYLRERRDIHPIDALYSTLCRRLGQLGLARAPDEGPSAYAARVGDAAQLAPQSRAAALEFLRRYSHWRYAPTSGETGLKSQLRSLLSQVR